MAGYSNVIIQNSSKFRLNWFESEMMLFSREALLWSWFPGYLRDYFNVLLKIFKIWYNKIQLLKTGLLLCFNTAYYMKIGYRAPVA